MTKRSPTVVFFGNERLATGVSTTAPILRSLIANGYTVVALVLNHERARSRQSKEPEIVAVAQINQIPIIYAKDDKGALNALQELKPTIGVLVAYGRLVSPSIIAACQRGIVNIHPSLLPLHRGPTPIESVILNDEKTTGVSIMQLTDKMDAGPIYEQCTISVPRKISKQELADLLIYKGAGLLERSLPSIINNKLKPVAQNDKDATYDGLIKKEYGAIDWLKTAEQIEREVRAFATWPKSWTQIGTQKIIITKADVDSTSGIPGEYVLSRNSLIVFAAKGALRVLRLQPDNKQEMSIEAFLAGYKL